MSINIAGNGMLKFQGGFMNWVSTIFLVSILSTALGAETISLKGTIKKTGGTAGIAGVKVSLTKMSGQSTTTGADGAFILSGTTSSAKLHNQSIEPIQFMVKGNYLVFAPTSQGIAGSVNIFSSDGKMCSSVRLHDLSTGTKTITLPRLGSGISIMKVSIGTESFTRTLMCIGGELIMKAGPAEAKNAERLILAKQLSTSAVDTLKAEKDGYLVKKVAIDKYTKDNIALMMDSSGGTEGKCTREALQAIADKYVEAQKAGDPTTLPLASEVKYIQNNKSITADKCIWKTAMTIDFSRSFFDVDSCRSFTEVISSSGSTPYVIITWLKSENGKIVEIDAMVTTTGDWLFDAKAYLKYSKAEDWSIIPAAQQDTRQTLINGGNAYLSLFGKPNLDTVPWGSPCTRTEGGQGHITPNCNSGVPTGKNSVDITKRRWAVDVDEGTVDIFCSFGGAMPDSHCFRLVKGKIVLVHTLSVQN